jgi:hypothetical protein
VLNFPIVAFFKYHYRKKCGGLAREEGGFWPCGKEFSAGLIFLCFVSFYLTCPEHLSESGPAMKQSNSGEKEMKRLKRNLPNKSKILPSLTS